jgi:endonuclease/exonuclease/phosphatase family metal-dependent hydrolase
VLLPQGKSPPKFSAKWRWAAGCLVIGAVIFWMGADRVPANATRPTTWRNNSQLVSLPGNSFRIASFNIHGGKGRDQRLDLDRVAACIAEARADFVGLNEVHGTMFGTRRNQADGLGQKLAMASQFVPTECRFWQPSFGNGLLSRVATTPVHKLPLTCTQGRKYRTATLTSFQAGNQTVRVISVHLDRVRDRESQLEQVFSLFCDLQAPAILMGDLNTFPDDPLLKPWLERGDIQDAVGDHLGESAPPRRIDWIFTRGLDTVDAGYLDNEASDHPLVWGEFLIPDATETNKRIQASERPGISPRDVP